MVTEDDPKLAGEWRTDPNDEWSLREFGNVSLVFENGGRLSYTIHAPSKDQIMHLTFRADGNCLVINQPSAPREERTEFRFLPDGRLALANEGGSRWTLYIRK